MKIDFNYRLIQLANNKGTALVDADDFEELSKYKWYRQNGAGYACRGASVKEKKNGSTSNIFMHRHIMNAKKGTCVDHKDGAKLDNRRVNLRFLSNMENARNSGPCKTNNSGHRGIVWNDLCNKWQARIMHKRKSYHLGLFDNINDAIQCRKEGEKRFGWEPAINTKGKKQYDI